MRPRAFTNCKRYDIIYRTVRAVISSFFGGRVQWLTKFRKIAFPAVRARIPALSMRFRREIPSIRSIRTCASTAAPAKKVALSARSNRSNRGKKATLRGEFRAREQFCRSAQGRARRERADNIEYGDIAHLVERLNGIQEVDGSSPFISTIPALLELLLFPRRFRRDGSIRRLQGKRGYPLKDSLS